MRGSSRLFVFLKWEEGKQREGERVCEFGEREGERKRVHGKEGVERGERAGRGTLTFPPSPLS